jgi:hypothetical protein
MVDRKYVTSLIKEASYPPNFLLSSMSAFASAAAVRAIQNSTSNTPFVVRPATSCGGSAKLSAETPRVGFDTFAYQCSTTADGKCAAVNQFNVQPGAPTFFSVDQCASSCGGLAAGTFMSPKAFP